MYIIKTKGNALIPDCIQIRNDSFILVAYVRVDRPFNNLITKFNLNYSNEELTQLIQTLPIGKLAKINTITNTTS